MIERHSTAWYEALDAYVAARADVPFAWGSNDCCTFAADWVLLVRGVDPMADLRGAYKALTPNAGHQGGAIAAGRALQAAGGLLAAVTQRMGAPIGGRFAQVGDVAFVTHPSGRVAVGVCVGAFVAGPWERGLLMLPITQAEAAWRV